MHIYCEISQNYCDLESNLRANARLTEDFLDAIKSTIQGANQKNGTCETTSKLILLCQMYLFAAFELIGHHKLW